MFAMIKRKLLYLFCCCIPIKDPEETSMKNIEIVITEMEHASPSPQLKEGPIETVGGFQSPLPTPTPDQPNVKIHPGYYIANRKDL